MKQNHGGHTFENDREIQPVVLRWLVAQDREVYQQRIEELDIATGTMSREYSTFILGHVLLEPKIKKP